MNQRTTNLLTVSLAACGLALGLWQTFFKYDPSDKAQEPRLNAYIKMEADQWGLYILNSGLGPAYVESLRITVSDGEASKHRADSFLTALTQAQLDPTCFAVGLPRKNDTIPVNEEVGLVYISKHARSECAATKLQMGTAFNEKLDFTLDIRSIHGNKFSYNFRSNTQSPL